MTPARTVETRRDGRVLEVRLVNPPRNFMTGRMVRELGALVRRLEGDRSIGALVITGGPPDVFIAHFDVEEILGGGVGPALGATTAGAGLRAVSALERVPGARGALARTPAVGALALREIHDVLTRLTRLDKAVVAAINGLALGGGCELALACDVRIMAEGPGRIGLPEVTLGIIPGAGGTQRLTRLLGAGRALELMLEGRALTAAEAAAVGLVHRAVPAAELLDEARATAARLARRSPAAIAALKRAVHDGGSRPLADGLRMEQAEFLAVATSRAARRAMSAYVERTRALGEVTPEQALDELEAWRAGTRVDLTGD